MIGSFMVPLLSLLLLFVSLSAGAEPLRIAVASNFLTPARVLAERFEAVTGQVVKISAGSTGKLYAQIVNGAPYDLFFAANAREPERLDRQGLIVPDSRFTYALGRLVLWSLDAGRLQADGAAWLKQGGYKRLSLANPNTAPYGAAAISALRTLGIADQNRSRLVRGENVSQAYQFVASGNVDAGFVAFSQIKDRPDGSYWHVPESYYPPIRQQAVWLKRAQDKPKAGAFMAWLRRPEIAALIRSFGYGLEVDRGA